MAIMNHLIVALLLFVLSFPAYSADDEGGGFPIEVEGLWQREGYNDLIHIGFTAGHPWNVTEYYVSDGVVVLEDRYSHDEYSKRYGNIKFSLVGDDRLVGVRNGKMNYRYFYKRLNSFPGKIYLGRGETEESRDPVLNFDVFWSALHRSYAYFDERGIDWGLVRRKWRPVVQASNDEATLQSVLASIIVDIGDLHTMLMAGNPGGRNTANPPLESVQTWLKSRNRPRPHAYEERIDPGNVGTFLMNWLGYREAMSTHVRDKVLHGRGRSGANNRLVWGVLDNGVGYIGTRAFSGLLPGEDPSLSDELAELRRTLDSAMLELGDTPAMVVDLRLNGGGYDALALDLVARFADSRRLAFSKQVRIEGDWSPAQHIFVDPDPDRAAYLKPTYVLIGDATASAAEICALAFRVLPHVTLAGASTMGITSDGVSGRLPNGWRYSFSPERYIAADGKIYEGLGVPPELRIPYEANGDHYVGFDEAIATASSRAYEEALK